MSCENPLTLQRCARLLPPDRPLNLGKLFLRGFDYYDVNLRPMKTTRLLQKFGWSCGTLSRGFQLHWSASQWWLMRCCQLHSALSVSWCLNTCAERTITHFLLTKYPSFVPGIPFVGSTTSKLIALLYNSA